MTKKELEVIRNYKNSDTYSIYEAYERPSYNKERTFEVILREMDEKNGYGMRILSKNTFVYTCAYRFEENGKEYLRYHTPSNVMNIEL